MVYPGESSVRPIGAKRRENESVASDNLVLEMERGGIEGKMFRRKTMVEGGGRREELRDQSREMGIGASKEQSIVLERRGRRQ